MEAPSLPSTSGPLPTSLQFMKTGPLVAAGGVVSLPSCLCTVSYEGLQGGSRPDEFSCLWESHCV